MSFILDALRKSEHERQRRTAPTLAATPLAPRSSRTPWIFLGLGFLLALNLVGLVAFWIWRDGREAAPRAAAPREASPGSAPVPGATVPSTSPGPAAQRLIRPLTEEALSARPDPLPGAPDTPDPELLPRTGGAGGTERVTPMPAPPRSPAGPASDTAGVPTVDQLDAAATAGLPVLNLDLHVFLPDPARRFVFINGTRYGEGATLKEGPIVERITRDGAVLNHRGVRFLLERP
jgi:general secretion pathway protein B